MPIVCGVLVATLAPDDPRWDRPSPDRFTLREVFAHLADYDVRFNDYLDKAMAASAAAPAPVPAFTPDEVAAGRGYGHSDPHERLTALRANRAARVAKFRALADADWTAHAMTSPRHGTLNIDELATLFAAHDGYHTRQIAEYVSARP
ncbi:MAG: DinB family protein [Janthinobacterium lividum]